MTRNSDRIEYADHNCASVKTAIFSLNVDHYQESSEGFIYNRTAMKYFVNKKQNEKETRKEYLKEYDAKRDKEEARKNYHKEIDVKRNKEEVRKNYNKEIDAVRDKKETRKKLPQRN